MKLSTYIEKNKRGVNLTMEYKRFVLGGLAVNTYLLWSGKEAGVIDPGNPTQELIDFIEKNKMKLKWIINTHGHGDHIEGNASLHEKYNIPIKIHSEDSYMLKSCVANISILLGRKIISPPADSFLSHGDEVKLGNETLHIIETQGHTKGSISVYSNGLLFLGDVLSKGKIGRFDFPGGDYEILKKTLTERIFKLPNETIILPGHGEESSVLEEKNRIGF